MAEKQRVCSKLGPDIGSFNAGEGERPAPAEILG
jgi:hypothetical protein